MISDIHWDNPKCDRELLVHHLKEAKRRNAKVIVNGDFFCLMQGRGDPRGSKDDIRPEHNTDLYLDAIVDTAVEWWKPWAGVLIFVGFGNHETSVIKHRETNLLKRFVERFNYLHKPEIPIALGGYGGWISFRMYPGGPGGKKATKDWKLHYFHGSGGGAVVTKNTIQHQRQTAMIEGADCIWMGHTHDAFVMESAKHYMDKLHRPRQSTVWQLQTPTYKEEFQDRHHGYHVEKGRPPKPLGGYWMKLRYARFDVRGKGKGNDTSYIYPEFYRTHQPISY